MGFWGAPLDGGVTPGETEAIVLHHILAQVAAEFECLEANLRQTFRLLAQGRSRADTVELEGVSIASPGVAFQMFNAAFLSSTVEDRAELERRLARAKQFFAARKMAWAFWICEGWLARPARRALTYACEDFGLRTVAEMPGMIAEALREPKRPLVSGLHVRRADTPAMMEDFRAIGSVCFHVPPPWFYEVFDDATLSRPFICWVGYRGSVPVATAATVVSRGVIGVYNVATMPDVRGRGYGEAVMRHAIEAAAAESGLHRVILQSTAMGESLYKQLGFREVTRVVVFNSGVRSE